MYKTIFHERINKAMAIREMKQIELAEITQISKSQINEYISGKCKPKQDKLYLISKALNVDPMWLMGFNVPMDSITSNVKSVIIAKLDELNAEQLEKLNILIDTMFINE